MLWVRLGERRGREGSEDGMEGEGVEDGKGSDGTILRGMSFMRRARDHSLSETSACFSA